MPPLQTIINEVFPTLLPAINQQNALPFPVLGEGVRHRRVQAGPGEHC